MSFAGAAPTRGSPGRECVITRAGSSAVMLRRARRRSGRRGRSSASGRALRRARRRRQPGPVGDHRAARDRAAEQHRGGRGAVIGAAGAVGARGAAELGRDQHQRVRPVGAEARSCSAATSCVEVRAAAREPAALAANACPSRRSRSSRSARRLRRRAAWRRARPVAAPFWPPAPRRSPAIVRVSIAVGPQACSCWSGS